MGTGFTTPLGEISETGAAPYDAINALPTTYTSYTTSFICNKAGSTAGDLGTFLQPLYDNPFYVETLLCSPKQTNLGFRVGFVGGYNDMSALFAKFNSLYCQLNRYTVTAFTTSAGLKTSTSAGSPTASEKLGANGTSAGGLTYNWAIIPQYGGLAYAVNPNTIIMTPNAAFTRFQQLDDGSGYTRQLAQCTITDAANRTGYSKVCVIQFA